MKLIPILCAFSIGLNAQDAPSKLVLDKRQVLEITESEINLDSLIMGDNSRIVFLAPQTKLTVTGAWIGKNCTWDVSGRSGKSGDENTLNEFILHGMPGRDLEATVMFQGLGFLTIDASGKNGRNGFNRTGSQYDGTPGGNGGHGGAVSINYGTAGFPVVINNGKAHAIHVKVSGGRRGVGNNLSAPNVPTTASHAPVRNDSQNASWDLFGNQNRAVTTGEARPRASRAENGGNGDIPQPMFIASDAQGVQYASVRSSGRPQQRRSLTRNYWAPSGLPGKDGSFKISRIE